MLAIRVHNVGDADVLRVEETPSPVPGPDDVLIDVEAIGVNFIEIYQRRGLYKVALPMTPGAEAAGTVRQVGVDVRGLSPGDRVATVDAIGAYAQMALVPAHRAVKLPDSVNTRQAAAVMLQGMTAHYLTTSTYQLEQGDQILVHAAAGGVGLLLCQLASQRGARVMGTASTEAKARLAREAGAEVVINYTTHDFMSEARRWSDGAGLQVVYDSVGRDTFQGSLDSLAPRGMLALFGQSSGPVSPFDPQLLSQKGSLFFTRPTLKHYVSSTAELRERADDILSRVAAGTLKVRVDSQLPLAQAAEAHRLLESRQTTGKVLLIP